MHKVNVFQNKTTLKMRIINKILVNSFPTDFF